MKGDDLLRGRYIGAVVPGQVYDLVGIVGRCKKENQQKESWRELNLGLTAIAAAELGTSQANVLGYQWINLAYLSTADASSAVYTSCDFVTSVDGHDATLG